MPRAAAARPILRTKHLGSDAASNPGKSAPVPAENGLEHEFRSEVRQRQHTETAQGPAHRSPAAPPVAGAADQQYAEKHPRDQRQNRLVNEMLLEQVGDEHESGEQSERQE